MAIAQIVSVFKSLHLFARDFNHGVSERVELRANLADLRGDQFIHKGLAIALSRPGQIVGWVASAGYR